VDDKEFRNEIAINGFCILPKIIDSKLINHIESEIESLVKLQLNRLGYIGNSSESLKDLLRTIAEIDLDAYFSCLKATESLYSLYGLLSSKAFNSISRAAKIEIPSLPINPRIHVMDSFINSIIEKKGGYHETPQHQDWPALQSSIDTLVIWIPLTDVKAGAYGIQIKPKSHLLGDLPTVEHKFGHTINPDYQLNEDNFLTPELKRGDAIVFSSFLVHRSEPCPIGDHSRIAFGLRMSNHSHPEFVNRVFPRSYKTIVDIKHGEVTCSPSVIENYYKNLEEK
tara:strand:+ start:272 stop:1117 length:846 start_codon:yes stop_codon:yes gene_type:complete